MVITCDSVLLPHVVAAALLPLQLPAEIDPDLAYVDLSPSSHQQQWCSSCWTVGGDNCSFLLLIEPFSTFFFLFPYLFCILCNANSRPTFVPNLSTDPSCVSGKKRVIPFFLLPYAADDLRVIHPPVQWELRPAPHLWFAPFSFFLDSVLSEKTGALLHVPSHWLPLRAGTATRSLGCWCRRSTPKSREEEDDPVIWVISVQVDWVSGQIVIGSKKWSSIGLISGQVVGSGLDAPLVGIQTLLLVFFLFLF